MKNAIWFDMDGTIADLYGNENWLDLLIAEDTKPYVTAKPLLNLQALARVLHTAQRKGYKIGIVSWLSKNGSKAYNKAVAEVKKEWLACHLASVKFDYIDIIPYGEPKQNGRDGILFDDEAHNRNEWGNGAYDVNDIINTIKALH